MIEIFLRRGAFEVFWHNDMSNLSIHKEQVIAYDQKPNNRKDAKQSFHDHRDRCNVSFRYVGQGLKVDLFRIVFEFKTLE